MLRQQGLKALGDIQGRLTAGDDPGQLLADGAMILISGVLLLTPGFFTDTIGFLLLVPGIRSALYRWGKSNLKMNIHTASTGAGPRTDWGHPGGQTVDGDFEDVTPGERGTDAPANRITEPRN